jgi:hypothetical protein
LFEGYAMFACISQCFGGIPFEIKGELLTHDAARQQAAWTAVIGFAINN